MKKFLLSLLLFALALFTFSCAPVTITKTYQEDYTDPKTGKHITYTESISQVPEKRMPIHLTHPELYQ